LSYPYAPLTSQYSLIDVFLSVENNATKIKWLSCSETPKKPMPINAHHAHAHFTIFWVGNGHGWA